jgi:wobble nucleotide-excising tRNase
LIEIKESKNPVQIDFETPKLVEPERLIELLIGLCKLEVNSQAIERLKASSEISQWAYQGLTLHKEHKSEVCHFCQNPLPKNLISDLEKHFNDSFGEFQDELKLLTETVERMLTALDIDFPDRMLLDPQLRDAYDEFIELYKNEAEKRSEFLNNALSIIKEKERSPFKSYTPTIVSDGTPEAILSSIDRVIARHNELCNEHHKRLARVKKDLELHHVAEITPKLREFLVDVELHEKRILDVEQRKATLTEEKRTLQSKIRDHHKSATLINELLKLYLGRADIKFQSNNEGYLLTRDGQQTHSETLSEGEKTAVALVYFLQHLNGEKIDKKQSIVVLDDPISSLDSNSVFSAFSFIRSQLRDCYQLFLLTHSHFLYKHLKVWFNREENQKDLNRGKRKKTAIFMIKNFISEEHHRSAEIAIIDELLERYNSEYHFIFSKIYNAANTPDECQLIEAYSFPNMARRLLEAFFSYRYPSAQGGLRSQLKKIEGLTDETKIQVEKFLHYKSHFDFLDMESAHDVTSLSEIKSTLRNVLLCIETADKSHFEEMKSIII